MLKMSARPAAVQLGDSLGNTHALEDVQGECLQEDAGPMGQNHAGPHFYGAPPRGLYVNTQIVKCIIPPVWKDITDRTRFMKGAHHHGGNN